MGAKRIRITEIKYYIGSQTQSKEVCSIEIDIEKLQEFKKLKAREGQTIYLTYDNL